MPLAARCAPCRAPPCALRAARRVARRSAAAPPRAAGGDEKPTFGRSEQQQRLADVDRAVGDAQAAAGAALLNAMGPLAGILGLRRKSGGAATPKSTATGQPARWPAARAALVAANLRSVTPAQTAELMAQGARRDSACAQPQLLSALTRCSDALPRHCHVTATSAGWVLLDVSPAEDFAECHAEGTASAPSVRYSTGGGDGSLRGALRSAAFASLAVRPAEDAPREAFLAAAAAALAGSGTAAGVVVACAAGGTLRPTANFPAGQASRSLFAAAALLESEALPRARVAHLRGGLGAWFADGRAAAGDGDWDDRKGRLPTVGGALIALAISCLAVRYRLICADAFVAAATGPMYEQDAEELR
jgi:hypothetical protein